MSDKNKEKLRREGKVVCHLCSGTGYRYSYDPVKNKLGPRSTEDFYREVKQRKLKRDDEE